MKNIFFVHSQITYIVAKKTIAHLKLNVEECIFLVHRGKSSDYKGFGVQMFDFPFNPQSTNSFPIYNKFWRNWSNINELDKFINHLTNNTEFYFYTPQTYQNYLALIVSHKNCKGFNIIEEGAGSYLAKEKLEEIYPSNLEFTLNERIKWRLNFFNRLKINRNFVEKQYLQAFGLTSYSFGELQRKVVLGLPTELDFRNDHQSKGELYTNILVFDALVEAQILDAATLLMTTFIFINWLKKKGATTLYVKYHPDQIKADKTIKLIKELFIQIEEIKIQEIPSTVSLEEVALKQDATFFVFGSSVGLYASFYGRKVISLYKVVERLSPAFSRRVELLPTVFKDKVTFLS